MKGKTCEFGVFSDRCGRPATARRQQPAGQWPDPPWYVCADHAAFLDRLRENVAKHRPLLERLRGLG